MDDRIIDWRRDVEEAIRENDLTHLGIVLERVFSEIDDAINGFDPDWEE
jgi:hypothetical protein